jgi:hypothetical protein
MEKIEDSGKEAFVLDKGCLQFARSICYFIT